MAHVQMYCWKFIMNPAKIENLLIDIFLISLLPVYDTYLIDSTNLTGKGSGSFI